MIKTEGLDEVSRTRITREAQAMGRLGPHSHIVTVFDLGQEADQPYMVTELMGGGDDEVLIEKPLTTGLSWTKPLISPTRHAVAWSSPTAGASFTET